MQTIMIIGAVALLIGLMAAIPGGVDLAHLFPPTEGRGVAKADPNTRSLTGNGGNLLMLGDCRKVNSVRVGDTALPEFHFEEYPVSFDSNGHPKLELQQVPLWQVIDTDDGPALQRSVKSNDGIWQAGVPIYVSGEWGKPKAEKAEAKKTEPAKDDKAKTDAEVKAEAEAEAKKTGGN